MTAPTRPVLRWHGGKWKLAPWIISHFPPRRIYVNGARECTEVLWPARDKGCEHSPATVRRPARREAEGGSARAGQ